MHIHIMKYAKEVRLMLQSGHYFLILFKTQNPRLINASNRERLMMARLRYSKLLLSENQNLSCGLEVKVDFYQYKMAKFSDKK